MRIFPEALNEVYFDADRLAGDLVDFSDINAVPVAGGGDEAPLDESEAAFGKRLCTAHLVEVGAAVEAPVEHPGLTGVHEEPLHLDLHFAGGRVEVLLVYDHALHPPAPSVSVAGGDLGGPDAVAGRDGADVTAGPRFVARIAQHQRTAGHLEFSALHDFFSRPGRFLRGSIRPEVGVTLQGIDGVPFTTAPVAGLLHPERRGLEGAARDFQVVRPAGGTAVPFHDGLGQMGLRGILDPPRARAEVGPEDAVHGVSAFLRVQPFPPPDHPVGNAWPHEIPGKILVLLVQVDLEPRLGSRDRQDILQEIGRNLPSVGHDVVGDGRQVFPDELPAVFEGDLFHGETSYGMVFLRGSRGPS